MLMKWIKSTLNNCKAKKECKILNKHPEIGNYGLNLDYNTAAQFQKEFLTRTIVFNLRTMGIHSADEVFMLDFDKVPMQQEEREMAEQLIQVGIENKLINPITYVHN